VRKGEEHRRQQRPESAPVLCKVKMINEYPLIPDLDRIESMIVEEGLQA